jgi:hypothetical protein
MTPVGFEPTQLALVELESTPLDHSGKVSCLSTFGSGLASLSQAHGPPDEKGPANVLRGQNLALLAEVDAKIVCLEKAGRFHGFCSGTQLQPAMVDSPDSGACLSLRSAGTSAAHNETLAGGFGVDI